MPSQERGSSPHEEPLVGRLSEGFGTKRSRSHRLVADMEHVDRLIISGCESPVPAGYFQLIIVRQGAVRLSQEVVIGCYDDRRRREVCR